MIQKVFKKVLIRLSTSRSYQIHINILIKFSQKVDFFASRRIRRILKVIYKLFQLRKFQSNFPVSLRSLTIAMGLLAIIGLEANFKEKINFIFLCFHGSKF